MKNLRSISNDKQDQEKFDYSNAHFDVQRRVFLKRIGLATTAAFFEFAPQNSHAIIPFGFVRKIVTLLKITVNGGTDLNVTSTWLNNNYGWTSLGKPSIEITNTGNLISSSTSIAALTIDVTLPAGKTLSFINNSGCYIVGRGGTGGSHLAGNGSNGGPAIKALTALSLANNGIIGGGGGGGGGTGSVAVAAPGGAGGGGAGFGGGGYGYSHFPAGTNGSMGYDGTISTGGAGSLHYSAYSYPDGGSGGNLGAPGVSIPSNGSGGLPGAALIGKSFVNNGAGLPGSSGVNYFGVQS